MDRGIWALPWGAAALLLAAHASADPAPFPSSVIWNHGENDTPRGAAMGGALRALGNGSTAVFLNPAGMVATHVYHVDAVAQISPEAGRRVFGGSVVDSVTGRLAGGFSLAGGWLDPDGIDRSFLDLRFGLAYPFSDAVFFGLAGRYAKVTQEGAGILGDSKASGGLVAEDGTRLAFVDTVSADAGLTIRAGDVLHLSVLGQNITYPGNAVLPTRLGGGVGILLSPLALEVDGVADLNSYDETTMNTLVGAEFLLAEAFPLRAGYRWDQGADLHFLSGGLGYIANEFSAEVSVRRSLSNPGITDVVFGLGYFLDSTGLTRPPPEL